MHIKISDTVFSSYSAAFEHHYTSLVDGQKLQRSIRIPRPQVAYICKHKPCCHSCYFASEKQTDFEDTVALMLGSCEITIDSIRRSIAGTQFADLFEDRFTHFLSSPKYRVICSSDDKCVKVDIEGVQDAARTYFYWVAEFNDSRRSSTRGSLVSLVTGRGNRKASSERGEHHDTCSTLQVRTDQDLEETTRQSLYREKYNRVDTQHHRDIPPPVTNLPVKTAIKVTRFSSPDHEGSPRSNRIQRQQTGMPRIPTQIYRQGTGGSSISQISSNHSRFDRNRIPTHITGNSFSLAPDMAEVPPAPELRRQDTSLSGRRVLALNTGIMRSLAV